VDEDRTLFTRAFGAWGDDGRLCGGRDFGGPGEQMPQDHQHAATAKAKPHSDMAANCQAMMAEREQMMTDVKAADQRLDDLVSKMNAASEHLRDGDFTLALVHGIETVGEQLALRFPFDPTTDANELSDGIDFGRKPALG
jgi:hypothetical protein